MLHLYRVVTPGALRWSRVRSIASVVDQVAPDSALAMDLIDQRIQELQQRQKHLMGMLQDDAQSLSGSSLARVNKELSELDGALSEYERLKEIEHEHASLQQMVHDEHEDNQVRKLASEELAISEESLRATKHKVESLLLPPSDDDDECTDAVLEVRAGAGGEEAALFAFELFNMYKEHARLNGWRFEQLGDSTQCSTASDKRGVREATASVSGSGCFSKLKWESGVHRVQRVPETETAGRVHTSTASVAVLPQADDIDDGVQESDVRVETMRASGSGGQHVNTTESAVRLTHVPSGTTVEMQDDRSQHRNKERAMKLLRARVYGHKREQQRRERMQMRRSIIGTMDRSERIRTYNFTRRDVKDHRCNVTVHDLDTLLANGDGLDEFVGALEHIDRRERLEQMREQNKLHATTAR